MTHTDACPTEQEIVRAVRTDRPPPQLAGHLETCRDCADTRMLARAFYALAVATQRLPYTLPDARVLWMRARFRRRLDTEHSLQLVHLSAGGVLALSAVVIVLWKFRGVDSLASFSGWLDVRGVGAPGALALILLVLLISRIFAPEHREHGRR